MKKLLMLSAAICAMCTTPAACDPTDNQLVVGRPRRVELVTRQSADVYVRMGSAERFRTLGCTVSATMMDAVVLPGKRPYIVFVDRDGEEEGRCELDVGKRPRRTAPPIDHTPIRRQIAVAR